MKNKIKWAIVVTADAPSILVKAFVAHHLHLGASEIFLYFDKGSHEECFDHLKRVFSVDCDSNYWQSTHKIDRPNDHRHRQILNANHAKQLSGSDWVCHIDIDEFLCPARSVEETLVSLPSGVQLVRIAPAENIYKSAPETWRDIFGAAFRSKFSNDNDGYIALQGLYGDLGRFFPHGLQSHVEGKIFLQKKSKMNFRIHDATYIAVESLRATSTRGQSISRPLPFQINSLMLLHFFSLGYADWCRKHLRRLEKNRYCNTVMEKRGRWDVFRAAASKGESDVRGLYARMNIISSDQEKILLYMNSLRTPDLKIADKVVNVFGSADHGFDERLPDIEFSDITESLEPLKNISLTTA